MEDSLSELAVAAAILRKSKKIYQNKDNSPIVISYSSNSGPQTGDLLQFQKDGRDRDYQKPDFTF